MVTTIPRKRAMVLACRPSPALPAMAQRRHHYDGHARLNHNNGFYNKALIAVWGGRVNDMVPLSYFSPYTLETHARWVPNPAGTPKYYLQLDERFTHIADEQIGPFSYDFADYAPWGFGVRAVSPEDCPCASSKT